VYVITGLCQKGTMSPVIPSLVETKKADDPTADRNILNENDGWQPKDVLFLTIDPPTTIDVVKLFDKNSNVEWPAKFSIWYEKPRQGETSPFEVRI